MPVFMHAYLNKTNRRWLSGLGDPEAQRIAMKTTSHHLPNPFPIAVVWLSISVW